MSGIESLPEELSETIADWFMVYGKCEKCIIEDNGGDDPELDLSEAVHEAGCRRCFTDHLRHEIDQKIDPTIKTKFCPTCGKSNE